MRNTAEMREYMRSRRASQRYHFIREAGGRCVQCGSREGLEFDHRDRSTKTIGMADLWGHSDGRVRRELVLCQLLCAKCHRTKTAREMGGGLGSRRSVTHGKASGYNYWKCRCDPCSKAWFQYKREHRAIKKNGASGI